MRRKLLILALGLTIIASLLFTGSGFAFYYPPSNIPPGPPPNYNQVDPGYFEGTPIIITENPPNDSGGFYIYHDLGSWYVANHIYTPEGANEQYHCCVLAFLSQPPALNINVFVEDFELWGDSSGYKCLQQNDRWGWIPWGDSLYEIWWDVSTKEWQASQGDPTDLMYFRISGCAIDFNLWSNGHQEDFGTDRIWLGANKTPLNSIPEFVDTYPGIYDPYQTAVGDPRTMPNTTIFTPKSDILRSYNINGLIDLADTYICTWALDYGDQYAGTFAYEGNGIQFSTAVFCPSNLNPNIFITPDTTVFLCGMDSVRIWIFASDPDAGEIITVEKTVGISSYTPQTDATPITDDFYFVPDTAGVYTFIFRVTDDEGATDEDTCLVTVEFNQPPQITCPEDGNVHAGDLFVSSDFSASDPNPELLEVILCGVTPAPIYQPVLVENHLEWQTDCADAGKVFTVCIEVSDNCEEKDICYFDITVDNLPPILSCPQNGSVHTGDLFVSTSFSVSDPDGESGAVTILGITPSPTFAPVLVGTQVEWQTTCSEDEDYTIRLVATDDCGLKDTCEFVVNVNNQPPQITCPSSGMVTPGETFVSNSFSLSDPDSDPINVTILSIFPASVNPPVIVGDHVEWTTTVEESGSHLITLRVTDECGLYDDCSFIVSMMVSGGPKIIIPQMADCVNPGDVVSVPVEMITPTIPEAPGVGGFELEIGYDFTTLTFLGASFDAYLENDLGWEYLTYRVLPCPECVCCEYKIVIYGQADMPMNEEIGVCLSDGWMGPVIWLDFLVCNNSLLRGLCLPIFFEWEDYTCTENTLSSCDGNYLFVSSNPAQYDEAECSHLEQYPPIPILEFFDGCILVCDEDSIKCERGDINLNHVAYEVADAVLFASYFVTLDVDLTFVLDPQEGQICATDINADGFVLSLADLVLMLQIIQHDVPAIPKVAPTTEVASMTVTGGTITAECTNPLSAMVFAFDDTVTPTLLANNMEMMVGDSRVLVWSTTGQTVQNAEVLSFTGAQLVSVQAVDNEARELQTVVNYRTTPTSFALHAAYPNPFNPYVNLSFSMPEAATYSLRIYNVAGQLVRSYDGNATTGLNVITWDGRDNSGSEVSSGVYFYKVTAAGNSATEKMVMMK